MNNWINFVKEYAVENGLSYREAMKEAKEHYQSGGRLSKSRVIRNIIYKDIFDPNKIKGKIKSNDILTNSKIKANKKVSNIEKKEVIENKESEEETIINNWNDDYIGAIIYNTKIGQNIDTLISRKNAKNEYIVDLYLLSFTKSINDEIIKKYGVEKLFEGIDKIAKYMDAENYTKSFGTQSSLPIAKYLNKANLKLVQNTNKELMNKSANPNINKNILTNSNISFDEFFKLFNKFSGIVNKLIKKHIDTSINNLSPYQQFNMSFNYGNQLKRQYLMSAEFKKELTSKIGINDIAKIKENINKYHDNLLSKSKHKLIMKNTIDEFKGILNLFM